MEKHRCKREDLVWDTDPERGGDTISFIGRCPVCGKLYEQVFTEVKDGLWDVKAKQYVILS